jgi:RNA polymerase sigma-70 factor (ECF subfamily)
MRTGEDSTEGPEERDTESTPAPSLRPDQREEEFRSLFRAHYPSLCRYAASLLGEWASAEDVVQDVFVRIWERHRDRLPLREPTAYLFRAVRNAAYNRLDSARATRRDRATEVNSLSGSFTRAPDAALDAKQTRTTVETALDALPSRQAEVFRLSRQHDLTYAQIAEVLDLSVSTVETHMGRALASLREALAGQLE